MPTRPQTWRFITAYDGFVHHGLRTAVDREASTPINRSGQVVRVVGAILDEATGAAAGGFTRFLTTGADGLRVRHERIELDAGMRGRGFARALHDHAEATYRRMGVGYVTLHAEHVGSLLWPALGFDFDLREQPGDTDAERRAHAVLTLLSPAARKVVGLPRPVELLADWASSEDARRRDAARALDARLPTAERLATKAFDGLLLTPLALRDYDAGASAIGRSLMLGASWDALKTLAGVDAADGDPTTRVGA